MGAALLKLITCIQLGFIHIMLMLPARLHECCLSGFWLCGCVRCAILFAWLPNIFIKYFINILMFKVAVIAGNLELAEVIQSHKEDDVGK